MIYIFFKVPRTAAPYFRTPGPPNPRRELGGPGVRGQPSGIEYQAPVAPYLFIKKRMGESARGNQGFPNPCPLIPEPPKKARGRRQIGAGYLFKKEREPRSKNKFFGRYLEFNLVSFMGYTAIDLIGKRNLLVIENYLVKNL
jgi:hypothetical protein